MVKQTDFNNRIPAGIPCCECRSKFDDSVVAKSVSKQTWILYVQKVQDGVRADEQRIFEAKQAEFERELMNTDLQALRINIHFRHIVENILTMHCQSPGCNAAIYDFYECFAVTCDLCKSQFCAWCLKDCGINAHPHVLQCPQSMRPGNYYGTEETFKQVANRRRKKEVRVYLAGKVREEDRNLLTEKIDHNLRDFNIDLNVDDAEEELIKQKPDCSIN